MVRHLIIVKIKSLYDEIKIMTSVYSLRAGC
jgi:hypothetical protein